MSRLVVTYKNKYACYSTIIEDFVTNFMSLRQYNKWRIKEYGTYCSQIKPRTIHSIEDIIPNIINVHGLDHCKKTLKQCKISRKDIDTLINNIDIS